MPQYLQLISVEDFGKLESWDTFQIKNKFTAFALNYFALSDSYFLSRFFLNLLSSEVLFYVDGMQNQNL